MNAVTQIRFEKGLTKGQVCVGAGISRPTLNAIEAGACPSAPIAKKLADYFEVPVTVIVAASEAAA